MSTDGFEGSSDTDTIEYTDNDSTGRPPPKNSGKSIDVIINFL
jgi:hypothetical protein